MFKKKTLFVVGAGASCEFDLPLGEELKDLIASKLRFAKYGSLGDHRIVRQLERLAYEDREVGEDEYFQAADIISRGLPLAISIDNFIDAHRGNLAIERCGKIAIFRAILEAERSSKLFFKDVHNARNIDISTLKGSWIVSLFRMATEGVAREDLDEAFSSFSFISFNYDRCLSHFFESALRVYYGIEREEAVRLVAKIPIFHPYGSLGSLEHGAESNLEFGANIEHQETSQLYKRLRTFTEQISADETSEMKQNLGEAAQIVFLGFGFHRQNLDLLKFGPVTNTAQVIATAYKVSDPDTAIIKQEVITLMRNANSRQAVREPIIENKETASGLLQSYWRTLTS